MRDWRFVQACVAMAALVAMPLGASAQEPAQEQARTNERVQVQEREQARVQADQDQQTRLREEDRLQERVRVEAQEQERQRQQARVHDPGVERTGVKARYMNRRHIRDANRSRVGDSARTRSRPNRTSP
jgi:hypothetical protein